MNRKFLEDLGLEKETIDKVLDENSKDIGKAKGQLDSVQAELETAKNTIKERDTQLADLKKTAGDNEALKNQITQLQEANKTKDAEMQAEIQKVKRNGIDELLLTEAKAKNLKAAKALLESIEESDDAKYEAKRREQIKALTESDDTKFMFGSIEIKGTEPGEPGEPGGTPDFSKMGYDELASYLSAHPDVKL